MSNVTQLSRAHYFTGESLNTSDFIDEQNYFLERLCWNTSSLNICGIASGLGVSLVGQTISVDPGVAFDRAGHTIVLGELRNMEVDESALADGGSVVIRYRETLSDCSNSTGVVGYKRVVEDPEILFLSESPSTDIILASVNAGKLTSDNRHYCTMNLGSLSFASSSGTQFDPDDALPKLSFCKGSTEADARSLRVDANSFQMYSPLTINQSTQKTPVSVKGSTEDPCLLTVQGRACIAGDLTVVGKISDKSGEITPSPWKHVPLDDPSQVSPNIFYSDGGVIIGGPNADIQENSLYVDGSVCITGDVTGYRFYGDGSQLKNLPSSKWSGGNCKTQNNIFYPGLDSSGKVITGAVGIGSYTNLGVKFPEIASLLLKGTAYVERIGGYTFYEKPITDEEPGKASALTVVGGLVVSGASEDIAANLEIPNGNLILTKGDLTAMNGAIKGKNFYGDGSGLTNVGYWRSVSDGVISYTGRVLVGTNSDTEAQGAQLYVSRELRTQSLVVSGPLKASVGSSADAGIRFSDGTGWLCSDSGSLTMGTSTGGGGNIALMPDGNVGIGTANPTGAKLVVNGSISVLNNAKPELVLSSSSVSRMIAGFVSKQGDIISLNISDADTDYGFTVELDKENTRYIIYYNHMSSLTCYPLVLVTPLNDQPITCIEYPNVEYRKTISNNFFFVIAFFDKDGNPCWSSFKFIAFV